MGYFGGGGVQGDLHPHLRLYIECFDSSPLPRAYPRGGGVWDQDPAIMRDFRAIRDYEVKWKATQEQLERLKGDADPAMQGSHGGNDLEGLLNEMLEERGEMDDSYF